MATLAAPNLKILTIHSYAIHGTASMKAFVSLLGSRVLPVPSLLLTGLTNIPGSKKTPVDFEGLLLGSLELARQQEQEVLLYVGYLGSPDQAGIILKAIESYADCIRHILVDPVSGDHGRLYVPLEIVKVWPFLLEKADWAFPNYTELTWLMGESQLPDSFHPLHLKAFADRFPNLSVIATSLPNSEGLSIGICHRGAYQYIPVKKLPQNYGGTGDVFAAAFVYAHFFLDKSLEESVGLAAACTSRAIQYSIDSHSSELLIYPDIFPSGL